MSSEVTVKHKICGSCKGHGSIFVEECTNYHRREYDWVWKADCKTCEGVGMVTITTKTITTTEIKPFTKWTKDGSKR